MTPESELDKTWNAAIEAAAKKASDVATLFNMKYHKEQIAMGAIEAQYAILSLIRPQSSREITDKEMLDWAEKHLVINPLSGRIGIYFNMHQVSLYFDSTLRESIKSAMSQPPQNQGIK